MLSTEWPTTSIRDVTLRTRTWNPQTEPRETINYVDVSSVSRETLEIERADEIAAAAAPSRARKIVNDKDTIFATIRPSLKRVAQVSTAYDNAIVSTAFCVLRPDTSVLDPDFLYFVASSDEFVDQVAGFETGASYPAVRDGDILDREINLPPLAYQREVASALRAVRCAALHQVKSLINVQDLKRAAMRALFTKGLRGEAQKDTKIGPVPDSWDVVRLDECAKVISTRMSYSELEALENEHKEDAISVLGIKVADMNLDGNEIRLQSALLEKTVARSVVTHRCAPPRTIIFPKRGAAIATNKKRLSIGWTAFDPNVIGVLAGDDLDQDFLFQWFQAFDLRTITEPGPTPQLNKKNLDPLVIPVPPTLEEQREIVAVFDAIDRKIDLHRRKRTVLDELFKALLHKLMTGEIRVADLDLSALEPLKETEVAA